MTAVLTIVNELQHAPDIETQASLIKKTRHIITGNSTRKTEAIRAGLLPSLTASIRNAAQNSTTIYSEVANIVNVLAHEGAVFVGPILHGELIPLFLQRLYQTQSPRERIALLRCLNAVAANLPSKELGKWAEDTRLADWIYDRTVVASLTQHVQDADSSLASPQICDYTLSLICKTCRTEKQRRTLVDVGLLKILAQRLAKFVVSEGLVVPSLETLDFPSNAALSLPNPAPAHAHLSPVLEVLALLIEDSPERIDLLLKDPSLTAVLPQPKDDYSPTDVRQAAWGVSLLSGPSSIRQRYRNAFDGLLPALPFREKSNTPHHLNFPPLGSGGPAPRRRPSFQPTTSTSSTLNIIPESREDKGEGTILLFLLLLARESRGKRRFLACKLVVILSTHKHASASRLRSFSGLLIPILVKMLDFDDLCHENRHSAGMYLCEGTHYKKAVPAVLAELIRDDPELQRAAVEANAILKLSTGLRSTFPTPAQKARPWRPSKLTEMEMQVSAADCILGYGGPSRTMRQEMAYREGTLHALAAIAPFDDDYRKQVCDQGVLAEIMLSMEPFGSQIPGSETKDSMTGNSTSTILAACGAVRSLTRSVTALRTKLVDAEVAKTVIKLMNSTDLEIRIAATKVLTNLAMEFSPMKDSVGDSVVVKKLCEQAHSANARLRLESIWALKSLVVNAPKKLKQEVVNELGSSWIKLLIRTDPYDIPEGEVIGLVDKDYPPRRSFTEASDDVVMSEDSDDEESMTYADAISEHMSDGEEDFDKHTPEDDLAIQQQVLDLIRNIFVTSAQGETAADLVDYVLQEMGTEEFFQIMKTRISPKTIYGPTRKDNQLSPPPAGVVARVLYIIIHIAACSQKWRMAVASEIDLLKRILVFSSHAEREVRVNCCWLAINLMFEDEVSDRASCRRRATELHKLGYRMQLQKLENDPDLDVRERAKTVMTLFSSLLDQR